MSPDGQGFTIRNGAVNFDGDCASCRPLCAAICCRGYAFVSLTEEEAQSGRYQYKEATENCGCAICTRMRELGVRCALRKLSDGSCVYLDGTRRCSIYDHRPETCVKYSCTQIWFLLQPPS